VLPEGIIVLVRLRDPALELCRLSNIGDREKASLDTICVLSLPELTPKATLTLATCHSQHPGHEPFSKNPQQHPPSPPPPPPPPASSSGRGKKAKKGKKTGSSSGPSRPPEGKVEGKVDSRRQLRFVPRGRVVNVVMKVDGASGDTRSVDLTVRCRTLFKYIDAQAQGCVAGAIPTIPWKEWGPTNTRIQESDSLTFGAHVGERRATVLETRVTVWDYNPYRVRRALGMLGAAGREVMLEGGSLVKVVKEKSVYRGGEWFRDDIETSLPYVETAALYKEHICRGVFMDEDNLVVEVNTEVSGVHLLQDVRASKSD
jgi:hypothetical protein